MRLLALLALAACSQQPGEAFSFLGVVHGEFQGGSVIGLWNVRQPRAFTYKLGDGVASNSEFAISYRIDLPEDALEGGVGVGQVAMLPGNASLPDGEVDPSAAILIGNTTDSAVIYRSPLGVITGYTWIDQFPAGFACAVCDRTGQPAQWVPADCTFVTVEASFASSCPY